MLELKAGGIDSLVTVENENISEAPFEWDFSLLQELANLGESYLGSEVDMASAAFRAEEKVSGQKQSLDYSKADPLDSWFFAEPGNGALSDRRRLYVWAGAVVLSLIAQPIAVAAEHFRGDPRAADLQRFAGQFAGIGSALMHEADKEVVVNPVAQSQGAAGQVSLDRFSSAVMTVEARGSAAVGANSVPMIEDQGVVLGIEPVGLVDPVYGPGQEWKVSQTTVFASDQLTSPEYQKRYLFEAIRPQLPDLLDRLSVFFGHDLSRYRKVVFLRPVDLGSGPDSTIISTASTVCSRDYTTLPPGCDAVVRFGGGAPHELAHEATMVQHPDGSLFEPIPREMFEAVGEYFQLYYYLQNSGVTPAFMETLSAKYLAQDTPERANDVLSLANDQARYITDTQIGSLALYQIDQAGKKNGQPIFVSRWMRLCLREAQRIDRQLTYSEMVDLATSIWPGARDEIGKYYVLKARAEWE